ncbi:MAG TPA: iron-sulfur cluster assembly accessory protein [Candidatus Eisenbacteria bacterium]
MSETRTQHPTHPTDAPQGSISLTPAAVEWVKRIRAKEGKEGQALRLGVKAGGCSGYSYFMGFTEVPRANDLVLRYADLVVAVDPRSLALLDGTVVDYQRGLLGSGIQFQNPRVKKSCGCGESFSL